MRELLKIVTKLKNTSSRSGKEIILAQNKDNKLFREVLRFVFDDFIITGLSTKKLTKKLSGDFLLSSFKPLNNLTEAMEYLKKNNTGRDVDILLIQDLLSNQENEEIMSLIFDILTKQLKLGITAKTINKIYGKDEIRTFNVQLAHSYEKHEKSVNGKFYLSLKLDGTRVLAIKDDIKVTFYTRKGIPIKGLTQLEKEMECLPKNTVYDGELLLRNNDNLSSDDLFRATQKEVRKDGEKKNVEMHVFDILPIKEFYHGTSKNIYSDRRSKLEATFNFHGDNLNHVKFLPALYHGDDKSVIPTLMKVIEENNYEGLMLNTADGLYETKRTKGLLKIKKFKSADLLVIALEEGSGKNVGKLGAVLVNYKNGITKVGTGFSDEERVKYWKSPDSIVGKVIEVKYFEESKDEKTQQPSLRFPVFMSVREDKTEEDVNID